MALPPMTAPDPNEADHMQVLKILSDKPNPTMKDLDEAYKQVFKTSFASYDQMTGDIRSSAGMNGMVEKTFAYLKGFDIKVQNSADASKILNGATKVIKIAANSNLQVENLNLQQVANSTQESYEKFMKNALVFMATAQPKNPQQFVNESYVSLLGRPLKENESMSLTLNVLNSFKDQLSQLTAKDVGDADSLQVLMDGARKLVQFTKPSSTLFSKAKSHPAEEILKELENEFSRIEKEQKGINAEDALRKKLPDYASLINDRDQILEPEQSFEVQISLQEKLSRLVKAKPELAHKVQSFLEACAQIKKDRFQLHIAVEEYKKLHAELEAFNIKSPTSNEQIISKDLAREMQSYLGSILVNQELNILLGPHGSDQKAKNALFACMDKIHENNPEELKLVDILFTFITERDVNLGKLSRNNGDVGEASPKLIATRLALNGYSNKINMLEGLPLEESERAKDLLSSISQTPHPPDMQVLTDSFELALPKNHRSPFVRAEQEKASAELEYQQKVKEANQIFDPSEKALRMQELARTRGFVERPAVYQRTVWLSESDDPRTIARKAANNPQNLPFVRDTIKVSYMSLDKTKILDVEAELDFSTLRLENAQQSLAALKFVEELSRIGMNSDQPFKTWIITRDRVPPPTLRQMEEIIPKTTKDIVNTKSGPVVKEQKTDVFAAYEKLSSLSDQQKAELLQIGLDFAYKMQHGIRLNRMTIGL